jgi:hypothetical protein
LVGIVRLDEQPPVIKFETVAVVTSPLAVELTVVSIHTGIEKVGE